MFLGLTPALRRWILQKRIRARYQKIDELRAAFEASSGSALLLFRIDRLRSEQAADMIKLGRIK